MAEPRIITQAPITPNGRWIVRCDRCQFAADSDAVTARQAEAEFERRHRHGERYRIQAEEVDYTAHPVFVGRFEHVDKRAGRPLPDPVPVPEPQADPPGGRP